MIDEKRLNFIIEDLEIYLKKLEELELTKENLKNDKEFLASSMAIFQILNRTIDLGDEIVRDEKLGYPLQTKDIFEFLENKKIISEKLSDELKKLVILRNKFSHRYEKLNEKDILKFISEDKRYILEFVEEIKNHVNPNSKH